MKRALIGVGAALLAFLLGVILVMTNHRSVPTADPSAAMFRLDLAEVFRGFDFAGSRVAREGDEACPFGWPKVAAGQRIYVFRYRDSGDADFQFDTLRRRFESLGITTDVTGREFSGGRTHPDKLQFQGRGYAGNITLHTHRTIPEDEGKALSPGVSDYVLIIVNEP